LGREDYVANLGTWLRRLFGSKEEEPAWAPTVPQEPPAGSGPEMDAEDSNDFALAMYAQLCQMPGNVFFSPFSIRTALGMTYAGARGETAAQMSKALRFATADETLHSGFSRIIQRLNAGGGGRYEIAVANALWAQDGPVLQAGFLDLIARCYGGALHLVDFVGAADAARTTINHWVEDRTRQKIRDIVPPGGVDAETRLVLVNAIYFKGKWVLQFRKAATRDEPFYVEGGGEVLTPLMHQLEENSYLQANGYQAVDLAYVGGDLSMLVLLPDQKEGLRDLEQALSVQTLNDCVARMNVRPIELFLPRFKMIWGTVDMCTCLKALGMTLAFDRSQADLSGINGRQAPSQEALFISRVLHKAFVEVNEEGTEAAAATAINMTLGMAVSLSNRVPVFRADHPFLVAVRDRKSGTILFLGRVADPTREN